MNRTKGILTAATLTGLVLITILALGFGSLEEWSSGDGAAAPAAEAGLPSANDLTNEETLQAWQEYSAQLEDTVRVLQDRDAAYQQQLDTANQIILQLQDQINNNTVPSSFEEHEEHERGEHEAFEFGEFDD